MQRNRSSYNFFESNNFFNYYFLCTILKVTNRGIIFLENLWSVKRKVNKIKYTILSYSWLLACYNGMGGERGVGILDIYSNILDAYNELSHSLCEKIAFRGRPRYSYLLEAFKMTMIRDTSQKAFTCSSAFCLEVSHPISILFLTLSTSHRPTGIKIFTNL